MRQYRAKILEKEFPFLEKLCDKKFRMPSIEKVDGIEIKRGDRNLLSQKGREISYSWSGGPDTCDYTIYFAVVGEEIFELKSEGSSSTGSGQNRSWDADTIGEQLLVIGVSPDYIVECEKNDTDANGNGEITRYWTIHKMSKFNLVAYHQEQIDKAAAVLKAEIAAACAEEVEHEEKA